jgi:hypothetical protein
MVIFGAGKIGIFSSHFRSRTDGQLRYLQNIFDQKCSVNNVDRGRGIFREIIKNSFWNHILKHSVYLWAK